MMDETPTHWICYHAGCADGTLAGAIVYGYLLEWEEQKRSHCTAIPVRYGDPLPPAQRGDTVWIVDFSWPVEQLRELKNRECRVLVFDHHRAAVDSMRAAWLDDRPSLRESHWQEMTMCTISTYLATDKCGALLVAEELGWRLSPLLNVVQDYDLWLWQREDTKPIMTHLGQKLRVCSLEEGLELYRLSLNPDIWAWWKNVGGFKLEAHQEMVEQMAKHARHDIWEIDGESYEVQLVNAPVLANEVADHLLEQGGSDLVACYRDSSDSRRYSLRSRSDQVDVSAIARSFGGGGHPRAAGFEVPLP